MDDIKLISLSFITLIIIITGLYLCLELQVIAIFGVHGATRSDQLYKLEVSNVDDRNTVIVVSLFDTKNQAE